ncbi:glycosyltransferase family 2 protein [Patescibacteria group bacterium]
MPPKVSINIVAWNSMGFLPDLLRSIFEQTYKNFQVLVIDNGSDDGVEAFVRENYPQVSVLRNMRNLGFCAAHNQGIRFALDRWSEAEQKENFIMVTNPDIILTPTFLEQLVKATTNKTQVGFFGGKLMRAYSENFYDEALRETIRSKEIDSTGLLAKKNRTFFDRGAGEEDQGQYDQLTDVFGFSGALCLYRAQALQDVRYQDEFFDQDFFAYKEDVDLSWRLQHLGWSAQFVPEAVAYHYRNMFGKEKMSVLKRLKNRRQKSKLRSYYSNRNHWNLLMKNERLLTGLLSAYRVWPHELMRFIYVLFFETANVGSFFEALKRAPLMFKKRQATMKKRRVKALEVGQWFR